MHWKERTFNRFIELKVLFSVANVVKQAKRLGKSTVMNSTIVR
ncbi:hypothetical protein [Litchfieldia alkalitelluris]|nr:hypothetical protein [Litchfieldia alkalitelluris]